MRSARTGFRKGHTVRRHGFWPAALLVLICVGATLAGVAVASGLFFGRGIGSETHVVDAGRGELLDDIPAFGSEAFVAVNDDTPLFEPSGPGVDTPGVRFSELDALGRSGSACALLGPETIATEEREGIGDIKPSGWHTVRYDDRIEDGYLYNRCHLIGYQLCGVNAEPRNLITGTRYLNLEGMLPLENTVRAYIERTGCHVRYRATPLYRSGDLVAAGVLIEASSVEDNGEGLRFCRFAYNVQPGVRIDYASGESRADEAWVVPDLPKDGPSAADGTAEPTYVLNTGTMKFHLPGCSSVQDMAPHNRRDFYGARDELVTMGYEPCGRCGP